MIIAALIATIGLCGWHQRPRPDPGRRGGPGPGRHAGHGSPQPGDKFIDQKFVLPDGTLVGYDYFFSQGDGGLGGQGDPFDEFGNPKFPMVNIVIPGERYRFVEAREAGVLIGGSLIALLIAGFVVVRRRPG